MIFSRRFISFFIGFALSASITTFAQTQASSVYNIHAEEESQTSIKITWSFESKTTDVKAFELYRAEQPFSVTYEANENAKIAELPPEARFYSDSVNDYHEYYYAIFVKSNDGTDRIILPSMNTTVTGAHRKFPEQKKQSITTSSAKEKIYSEGKLREKPLPALDLLENHPENEYPLKPEVIKIGNALGSKTEKEKYILEPYAFDQDLISPEGGEDFLLFDILHKTFARKRYEEGITQLTEFLSVNHSENVTTRTYFYLGECQYFSGNFKDAVMTFLKVHESFPDLTQEWIDSSLDLIVISNISD